MPPISKGQKIAAYSILFFSLAYVFIAGFFGDSIANWSAAQPLILQLITYYLTQPAFIIILVGSIYLGAIKKRIVQALSGGFILDIVADIVSTPHCVTSSGFINSASINLCSDTIYIRWLDMIFPHIISYSIYYWILPIILVVVAFELLGVTQFLNYFKRK